MFMFLDLRAGSGPKCLASTDTFLQGITNDTSGIIPGSFSFSFGFSDGLEYEIIIDTKICFIDLDIL